MRSLFWWLARAFFLWVVRPLLALFWTLTAILRFGWRQQRALAGSATLTARCWQALVPERAPQEWEIEALFARVSLFEQARGRPPASAQEMIPLVQQVLTAGAFRADAGGEEAAQEEEHLP